MSHVEAVYRHGVFQPLGPVNLAEDQRVRLSIEPAGLVTPQSWLRDVRQVQDDVIKRQGVLPDSTLEIAADRQR